MSWEPLTLQELQGLLSRDLRDCGPGDRALFEGTCITPVKWRLSPWGDLGGGFWAVAVSADLVLWYNDIEEGFNVSRFLVPGEIPSEEYLCNQDSLKWALAAFKGELRPRLGPPRKPDGR